MNLYKKIIWNGLEKDIILSGFFDKTFYGLEKEMDITANMFFPNNPSKIFELCVEKSWMGLWSNSIIKAHQPNVSTLIEASLYNKDNHHTGRLDLMVSCEIEKKILNLLFEGKHSYWKGSQNISYPNLNQYYETIRQQAQRYKNCLDTIVDYKIIAIIFEWMNDTIGIEKAKEYFDKYNEDKLTQFCALYTIENKGMWVYGRTY